MKWNIKERKNMKAIPVTIDGIDFRSKLEARHYGFYKRMGWNAQYEPEVPGVIGYQPDFLITPQKRGCSTYGDVNKLFIEIKPITNLYEFFEEKYDSYRKKLDNSGILNVPNSKFIIVGSNLHLGRYHGSNSVSPYNDCYVFGFFYHQKDQKGPGSFELGLTRAPRNDYSGIGLIVTYEDTRNDLIADSGDSKCRNLIERVEILKAEERRRGYIDEIDIKSARFVERSWNEAWSALKWTPTHEEYHGEPIIRDDY
jgi:hypothetical protein